MKCDKCYYLLEDADDAVCAGCTRSLSAREFVDLVLIALAYMLAARLAYYIFSGDFLAGEAYSSGQRHLFSGLRDFAFPISIESQPAYCIVIGTLFAVLLAVPVLVAAYYSMIAGMFLGAVGGGLFMPVSLLAVIMPVGAFLAGTRLVRFRNKLWGMLLGLAPPGAYLVNRAFTASPAPDAVKLANPAIALAPLGVAFILAAVSFACAAAAVRRRRYDARFLLPWTFVAAIMCLVLVAVGAGFDRISYAFVYNNYRVGSGLFSNVRVDERSTVGLAGTHFVDETTGTVIDPGTNFIKTYLAIGEADRKTAADAFERFAQRFPSSRFVADAYYQKARALNLKLDLHLLKTREHVAVGVSRITREAMAAYDVVKSLPRKGPQAALAAYETALYLYQQGRFDLALETCARIRAVYSPNPAEQALPVSLPLGADPYGLISGPASARTDIYDPFETSPTARLEQLRRVSLLAVRLAGKIERTIRENGDFDRLPLAQFAALDPYADSYTARLDRLIKDNADSKVLDNMLVARYVAHGEIDVGGLKGMDGLDRSDVEDDVNYYLGLGCYRSGETDLALEYLRKVASNPESPGLPFARYLIGRIEAGRTD